MKRVRSDRGRLVGFLAASVLVMATVVAVVVNFTTIRDFFVGMRYRPSGEMERIRTALDLTDSGYRIFNAAMPELLERNEFNQICRESANESAVLGCYRDDLVYVYNVVDEELPGVRELATAHELLHAVYARMSEAQKTDLVEPLTRVFDANQELLESEINLYDISERQEELYVRAGTEVKNLPSELEEHFAGIFKNQDAVVDFYEGYISVFREIEKKLKNLLAQTEALSAEITAKTSEYETRAATLNAQVQEFNACAGTLDCFASTTAFNNRRRELVAEQTALETLYNEINSKISQYNALVVEYNDNLLHGQILNQAINSSAKVESVGD